MAGKFPTVHLHKIAMDPVTPVKAGNSSGDTQQEASKKTDEAVRTPVRPGRGSKRKLQSPSTPTGTAGKAEDSSSVKKRRKSTSGTALTRVASPSTSLLKPPLTERQQMALLLQMTDPSKQTPTSSPAASHSTPAETPPSAHPTPDSTPRRGVQRKNERGETPLHIAAIKGDLKAVMSLLQQGADVGATDHAGWTPLHEACNHGHSAVVRELLDHKADVNVIGMDGDSPMHDAVGNEHLETVRVLLEYGGDLLCCNEKGLTPIDICTNPNILTLLKSHQKATGSSKESIPIGDESVNAAADGDIKSIDNKGITEHSEKALLPSQKALKEKENTADEADKEVISPREATQDSVFIEKQLPVPTAGEEHPIGGMRARHVSFSDISSSENEMELTDIPDREDKPYVGEREPRTKESADKDSKRSVREPSIKTEGSPEVVHKGGESCPPHKSPPDFTKNRNSPTEKPENIPTLSVSNILKQEETESNEKEVPNSTTQSTRSILSTSASSSILTLKLYPVTSIAKETVDTPIKDGTAVFSDQSVCGAVKNKQLTSLSGSSGRQSRSTTPKRILRSAMKSPEPSVLEKDLKGKLIVLIPRSLVSLPLGVIQRWKDSHSRAGSELSEDLPSLRSLVAITGPVNTAEESPGLKSRDVRKLSTHSKEHSPKIFNPYYDTTAGDVLPLFPQESHRYSSCSSLDSSVSGDPYEMGEPLDGGVAGATEKHSKHSRKSQPIYSSNKLLKECRRESDKYQENRDISESFSVSVDWNTLKSPTNTASSVVVTHGPIRKQTDNPDDDINRTVSEQQTSPTALRDDAIVDNKYPGLMSSKVISFSMSLPLVFSSQRDTTTTAVARSSASPKMVPLTDDKKVVSNSSLSQPGTFKKESNQGGKETGSPSAEFDGISLPPKRRLRGVLRSTVVQQRLEKNAPQVCWPANFHSFFMNSNRYRSKDQLLPVSPKVVYPPLPTAMYKQFSEQEVERVRLATTHVVEQDRLLLSMEQEILRAQQRATKGHISISACSVLLERLLPHIPPPDRSFGRLKMDKESGLGAVSKPRGSEDLVDSRLLCGLVQDVWDKFNELKFSLLSRHRHESESLWLTQREQWMSRLTDLGVWFSQNNVPTTHVPVVCVNPF